MRKVEMFVAVASMLALAFSSAADAGLRDVEKGVLVEDFEDGKLDGWEITDPSAVDIGESAEGGHYLKLGGVELKGQMWIKGRAFGNFIAEVKVRKLYNPGKATMGFRFRNNCSANFHAKGRLDLASYGKTRLSTRELRRVRDLERWTTLKLVCAGEVVTAYVDGDFACQLTGVDAAPGKLGLFAQERVYFDDLKISETVEPEHYLGYEVVSDDNCLVFDPGKDLALTIRVKNYHADAQTLPVRLVIRDWQKKALVESKAAQVTVPGRGESDQSFPLGKLAEGYYQVLAEPLKILFPLAVHERPGPDAAARPEKWPGREGGGLLFGVYWYFKHWELPELWKNTYCHAAAQDLRRHHFNAIVNMIGMPADQIAILSKYGIACHSRNGNHMENPLLAGTLVSDEPRPEQIPDLVKRYTEIRELDQAGERCITTCMIGDGGLKHADEAWKELLPLGHVRLFRWYGIKKEHFGVWNAYPGRPSYTEVMRDARSGSLADGYPYWVILPSLGSHGPDSYFGLPSPSQVSSMMHLAAAHQARGFIFWTYQDNAIDSKGLVNSVSLLPNDGRWAMAGKVAATLTRHAELLNSLKLAGPSVWCDSPFIEFTQYTDETQENQYLYVVNKHPRMGADFKLFRMEPESEVHDLYADKRLKAVADTIELLNGTQFETGSLKLSLGPGEGTLLQYYRKVMTSKPVAFPSWIENAAKEDVQYLYDLETTNTPSPGWVRAAMMKKMKKSIGEMWKWHGGTHKLYSARNDLGVEYAKCLYAHAECRADYVLPEGFTHFVAAAGFGNTSPEGDVLFQVYVDGKKKFDSGIRTTDDPVLPVVVDITGAKRLSLVTDSADYSLKQDYVFWGSARLVRK